LGDHFSPSWSHNSNYLVYVTHTASEEMRWYTTFVDYTLSIVNIKGDIIAETTFNNVQLTTPLSWFPDSHGVIFCINYNNESSGIYSFTTTEELNLIIQTTLLFSYPSVSPSNSKQIICVGSSPPTFYPGAFDTTKITNRDIYRIQSNGTGLTNLTSWMGFSDELNPQWLPDGSGIIFTVPFTLSGNYDCGLYFIRPDGTGLIQLFRGIVDQYYVLP
ncbi:MAG: hypothetical protein QME64_09555, partial [bacterium]|nr:hypothetical protein [bacterium]